MANTTGQPAAQHTPGPMAYRGDRTIAANGVPLARCYAGRNGAANGPLFAAAPDLLAALRSMTALVDHLLTHPDDVLDEHHSEEFDRARAAIAKAEGRS